MSRDISDVLEGWDFDPHELNVRVIEGKDGSEHLQMRIELGVLQMAMVGRPDGKRPKGCESLLDHYEAEAVRYGDGYRLSPEAVDELFREGYQFYQRYLCLFHLGYYREVVRDTQRNLRLFAFAREHAKRKRDAWRFDQYRPYVVMMRTRALGMISLQNNEREKAIAEVDQGCKDIDDFLNEYGLQPQKTDCFELDFLRSWREELLAAAGVHEDRQKETTLARLRAILEKAISREDYEYAAVLRDQIRQVEQTGDPPSSSG